MPVDSRSTCCCNMFRCSNSVFRSSAVTVRDPIEYDDAPPVRSASIAASICASKEDADAMPAVLRDGSTLWNCHLPAR